MNVRFLIHAAVCFALSGCAIAPSVPPRTRAYNQDSRAYGHKQEGVSLEGSYHMVRKGDTIWRISRLYGISPNTLASSNGLTDARQLNVGQRLFVSLAPESRSFFWPVIGSLRTSNDSGVDIQALSGSLVRASRSGRVAVAAQRLSGLGKTVVIDHGDGYVSIYSGLEKILVRPSLELRGGSPIGSIGSRALHFEIRYGTMAKNVLALLPSE